MSLHRRLSILTTRSSPRIARTFLLELRDLFVHVLVLAQEAGMLKLGTISLDRTKVHADTSRRKAVRDKRLLELEIQLRARETCPHQQRVWRRPGKASPYYCKSTVHT